MDSSAFIKPYVKRHRYLDLILPYVDQEIIKVIIGQRRVGKSYFLFHIMDWLKENRTNTHILYINKEHHEFDFIETGNDLVKWVMSETAEDAEKTYLLIDEIQEITGFEKALQSIQVKGRWDVYCTGSNAELLSGELATGLSGRYVEIKMFSLSYMEFLQFHSFGNSQEALLKYIKYGGLPFLRNLTLSDDISYDYLKNIYAAILYKDVVARFRIRNVFLLERLVMYLAENTGSIVSAKRISDFLKSQRMTISPNVILNYLSYLESAFFILKVRRSDVSGKKIFSIGEKYYFQDLGLRHALIGYRLDDVNKVLENLVYMHLALFGFQIFVGKMNGKEIDFVAHRKGEKLYVQVAYMMHNEKTRDREFGNLLKIPDNHPKIVVSMEELTGSTHKGIRHIHIRDFLSSSL